jgi:adenylate kinase family enzyme
MVANASKLLEQHFIYRIRSSKLLSVADLHPVLQTAVSRLNMEGNQIVVFDGFPRDIEQVSFLDGTSFQTHVVLFFNCPGEIAQD